MASTARPGPFLRRPLHRQADQVEVVVRASPAACLLHPVGRTTISSTRTASWTCGCVKRACSSTAPAPARTSPICAAKAKSCPAAASSSGLMSFLKIGDRAAGAIKSGGTTRRAAKMVVVDIDHPDIEAYIDWKVKEEQKVAALVTGSKIVPEAPQGDHEGLHQLRGRDATPASIPRRTRPQARNQGGQAATRCRTNYVQRVIQFARQGYKDIEFKTYDTDWDSRSLSHRLGPELQQFRLAEGRLPARRRNDGDWNLTARKDGKVGEDAEGPRPLGADLPRRLGIGRSGPALQHDDERLAHLPGRRARSAPRTRARNTCSSTTRPATSPR
jgi:hypothetical protein